MLTFKRAILSIIATIFIAGTMAYFTVHPFAYNDKDLAKEISGGLTQIKEKHNTNASEVKFQDSLDKLSKDNK